MDYVKNMVLFKRRCSDPSPQLVSLSHLSEVENTWSNQSLCSISDTRDTNGKLNSGLTTWGKKVGQRWDKLKRNHSSEVLFSATSGRRRHWSPIRTNFSFGGNTNNKNKVKRAESVCNTMDETDVPPLRATSCTEDNLFRGDYKKLYQIYKTAIEKKAEKKIGREKDKKRLKTYKDNVGLTEKQFVEYMSIIKPNSHQAVKNLIADLTQVNQIRDESLKMESLLEDKAFKPKQKKFKGVINVFSKFSHSKSDDEGEYNGSRKEKNGSSSSLPNLIKYFESSKKAISLSEASNVISLKNKSYIKCDESGYGSDSTRKDSPRGSIKSENSNKSINDISSTSWLEMNALSEKKQLRPFDGTLKEQDRSKFRSSTYIRRPRSQNVDTCRTKNVGDNMGQPSEQRRVASSSWSTNETNILLENATDFKLKPSDQSSVAFPSSTLITNHRYTSRASKLDQEFKCVRLRFDSNAHVGLKIASKDNTGRYIITDIAQGSIAKRNGNLRIGDEIVKINGTRLRGMPFTFAICSLKPVNNELEIVVSREIVKSELKLKSNFRETNCSYTSAYTNFLTVSQSLLPTLPTHTGIKARRGFIENSRFITNNVEEKLSSISDPPSKNCKLTGMRKFSFVHDGSTRKNVIGNTPLEEKRYVVKFKKGKEMKSLGFSIVGGSDSPRGAMDLYVKTIFEKGQAADGGVLRKGDKLLYINGKSFQGLTNKEAISLFKCIKTGDITLVLERNH